jgi:hypothetical protein
VINETKLSKNLMEAIRSECRGAFVFKHGGNFVGGWPDVSATYLGDTFLFEDKLLRKGESYKKLFKGRQNQLVTCHQLAVTSGGKCWVVVYKEDPKVTEIWQPRAIAEQVFPNVVLPLEKAPGQARLHLIEPWPDVYYYARTQQMVWCHGWRHDFVVKLMKDYLCRKH